MINIAEAPTLSVNPKPRRSGESAPRSIQLLRGGHRECERGSRAGEFQNAPHTREGERSELVMQNNMAGNRLVSETRRFECRPLDSVEYETCQRTRHILSQHAVDFQRAVLQNGRANVERRTRDLGLQLTRNVRLDDPDRFDGGEIICGSILMRPEKEEPGYLGDCSPYGGFMLKFSCDCGMESRSSCLGRSSALVG